MMAKYFLLLTALLSLAGCRERTPLERSYAFDQRSAWQALKEGLKQNLDSSYVPDYTKAIALGDSAIKYSPDDFLFYELKASKQEQAGDYRGVLDTYLRLVRRDTSRARYFHCIAAAYDSLGTGDSAAYFYRKALEGYRREATAAGPDSTNGRYNPRGRTQDVERLEKYLAGKKF